MLEIARAFAADARLEAEHLSTRTVTFPPDEPTEGSAADIREAVSGALNRADFVIIDLDFPVTAARPGATGQMLLDGLWDELDTMEPNQSLLLVVDMVPLDGDPAHSICVRHPKANQISLVATHDGHGYSQDGEIAQSISEASATTYDDLIHDLGDRLLRYRGVFESIDHPGEYMAYYFSLVLDQFSLRSLLLRHFRGSETDLVLYQSRRDGWLEATILGVVPGVDGMSACHVRLLDDDGGVDPHEYDGDSSEFDGRDVGRSALRKLDDPSSSVLIVVPFVNSGRAVSDLVAKVRRRFSGEVRILALMLHDGQLDADGTPRPIAVEGEYFELDAFVEVSQEMLDEDDWRVRAARASGQTLTGPPAAGTIPSLVGFWSMLAGVGAELETVVPNAQGRHRMGIRWFPRLHAIEQLDALWLADAIMSLAADVLEVTRENLLVIVPEEHRPITGATPIGDAIRDRLDVAVVALPRAVIDGEVAVPDAIARALRSYQGYRMVVVDESTVTYGTIRRINSLVAKSASRQVDLAVVAVELANDRGARPEKLISLFSWRPWVLEGLPDAV